MKLVHPTSEVLSMPRPLSPRAVLCCLAALTWFGIPAAASAQNKKTGEEVQFESPDKVELHGTFYSSDKAKAPCVILLHNFGGNRQEKGIEELAQAMSKEYAVLTFDFRGHGESTKVDATFWGYPNNALIKGSPKRPSKINFKDFPTAYRPVLANDVLAARRFLDKQNDGNECNSSNIIVIGAEEGAAIGALWIASEWQRFRMTKNALGRPVRDTSKIEGEDIACAVWLSIPKTLGAGGNVGAWLRGPGNKVRDKVPMAFFYGEKDQKAASAAQALLNELKPGKEKLEFTAPRAIKGTSHAGANLIGQKSLKTEEDIVAYLEKVMQKRGNKAWVMRANEFPLPPIPFSYFGLNLR
jgi:dienelactone hydrolase